MLLDDTVKSTIRDAARKLTGHRKRDFMAKVTEDYLSGSARKAERVLGWNRNCVQLGLHERRTGLICVDAYQSRGRHKSEELLPNLAADIRSLVDAQAQENSEAQSTSTHPRMSARAVREALIEQKGYTDEQLPTRQTIGDILNRLGYRRQHYKRPNS